MSQRFFLLGSALLALGCSSGGSSGGAPGGGAGAGGGGGSGGGAAAAPGWQLGDDGSPAGVSYVELWEPPLDRVATDLDFNPARPGELWAVMRPVYDGTPCTSTIKQGCTSLESSVVIITDATGPAPTSVWKKDTNAWHFMRRATSIAFGPGDTFATCGEARTGNFEDDVVDYMGPTLWSSDPDIFAKNHSTPPGYNFVPNGSHLDMLHGTPDCMGIAHDKDNVYWCFNGQSGAIDRYDFMAPHPPGGDDHSDGTLHRYVDGQLGRVPEVMSHVELDKETRLLYVADTGNKRVVVLDTNTGTEAADLFIQDAFFVKKRMDGASLTEIVPPGQLEAPSGIALADGVLFVSDHATGKIHAFSRDGQPVRTLDTGLPPNTLAGIALGPDQKLYLVDMATSRVRRIEPLTP